MLKKTKQKYNLFNISTLKKKAFTMTYLKETVYLVSLLKRLHALKHFP